MSNDKPYDYEFIGVSGRTIAFIVDEMKALLIPYMKMILHNTKILVETKKSYVSTSRFILQFSNAEMKCDI
ncbi:hypothetical protein ANSO36C_42870 [Nostoc cf. commune SO-36]|uniref:Uncharacterized protein n=1 Tax=Nostoc cf. commune SO-36 TaxID=449208 RepID=A0ABM7Z5X0_NOSCO|nr:hypothetical protein ANSO36C_42870 [Nostoc cf. commune SO-36]